MYRNYDNIILECYNLLYENSTPSINFNELMEKAELNEYGQKIIPFNDHCISEELFYEIINSISKKYKLNRTIKEKLITTLLLGCSPRFEEKNIEQYEIWNDK